MEALHDQMSLLKVEHSTELDESKRDMKMVLKSVKAEEHRLATELTEQISQLKNQLADEKRTHQVILSKYRGTISLLMQCGYKIPRMIAPNSYVVIHCLLIKS